MGTFEFEVFYDGDCPLCVREITMLRRLDRRGAIRFTDIAARDFDPASTGRTMAELMDRIHGRPPNGELVEGVEVFRRLYGAVGLGFLLAWTTWPVLRGLADWGYRTFAKNRLRLTGRCVKSEDGVCTIAPREA